MIINYNLSSEKLQALLRLFFLQLLIPAHFEPELSLALDRALVAFEGAE
jgi:hypothetical protein